MWFHKMAKEIWEEHSIEMMWDDFGESSGDQPVYLLAHVGWKDGRWLLRSKMYLADPGSPEQQLIYSCVCVCVCVCVCLCVCR